LRRRSPSRRSDSEMGAGECCRERVRAGTAGDATPGLLAVSTDYWQRSS